MIHIHNKSSQFDEILKIFKIHLSELMTSAHFRTIFLKKYFDKNVPI